SRRRHTRYWRDWSSDVCSSDLLKLMATRGVFIGGGIAPKIISKLQSGLFMDAFASKGRFEPLLRSIPVHVLLNDQAALLGAAHYAATQAGLIRPASLL